MWTDRSSVWRKDCWSELDFRQGKKEFKRSAKLDSSLKHCHSHDHCWNIYEASPFINFRTAMIMSNFGTTVVSVKKEDISINACWGQNLNLVDDSLSRFDRQVIEEKNVKRKTSECHTHDVWVFPSSTFWIPTLFLKLAFKRNRSTVCLVSHGCSCRLMIALGFVFCAFLVFINFRLSQFLCLTSGAAIGLLSTTHLLYIL